MRDFCQRAVVHHWCKFYRATLTDSSQYLEESERFDAFSERVDSFFVFFIRYVFNHSVKVHIKMFDLIWVRLQRHFSLRKLQQLMQIKKTTTPKTNMMCTKCQIVSREKGNLGKPLNIQECLLSFWHQRLFFYSMLHIEILFTSLLKGWFRGPNWRSHAYINLLKQSSALDSYRSCTTLWTKTWCNCFSNCNMNCSNCGHSFPFHLYF